VAVIWNGEIGTVVDKDSNSHSAQTFSLDFRISKTTANKIGMISSSFKRVSCTLPFIIDIIIEQAKMKN